MTPATRALQAAGLRYQTVEYVHDPTHGSYGLEAAEALGVNASVVFKTLICRTDTGELLVGIVPVDTRLDLKAVATAAGTKRVEMAQVSEAERSSGYVTGGMSPIGQKRALRTFLHEDALLHEHIYVSGGRRGLEIILDSDTLITATEATVACIARSASA